jgi:hypothetical protein
MSKSLTDEGLVSLAVHADARNQTLGIVGVLFVAGNRFMQVLEGEKAPVRWLYAQIAEDSRHRRMTKLMDGPIERRAFIGWSMRLLGETDLSDNSRYSVLKAIGSADFLDVEKKPAMSDLADLQLCPAALASSALLRKRKADCPLPQRPLAEGF